MKNEKYCLKFTETGWATDTERKDKKSSLHQNSALLEKPWRQKKLTAVVREPRGKEIHFEGESHSPENTNQTLQQEKDTKSKQFY